MGGDNEGKREKGCQGTCIKDTWTKVKAGRMEGRRWGWQVWVWSGRGKMETTALGQQFKKRLKIKKNRKYQ